MTKENFKIVEDSLNARIDVCKKYLDGITNENDLENLTISQIKELKTFCDDEVVRQTNILMVDLYHIIGMCDLNASQLTRLMKLIKAYSSYRPDIKAIAKNDFTNIYDLPKIPQSTKFKCYEFDLELINKRLDGAIEVEEDNETVENFKRVSECKNNLGNIDISPSQVSSYIKDITIDENKNTLIYDVEIADKIAELINNCMPGAISTMSKFITCCQEGGSYCGFNVTVVCDKAMITTNKNSSRKFNVFLRQLSFLQTTM